MIHTSYLYGHWFSTDFIKDEIMLTLCIIYMKYVLDFNSQFFSCKCKNYKYVLDSVISAFIYFWNEVTYFVGSFSGSDILTISLRDGTTSVNCFKDTTDHSLD